MEVPHAYPAEVVARFLSLATEHRFDAEDERVLWDVLAATGHLSEDPANKAWMEFPTGESLLLLVLTDFLESRGVQHAPLSLSGLGLFSRPVHELMPLLGEVRGYLKEQADRWQRIVHRADRVYTQEQAEKAMALITPLISPEQWVGARARRDTADGGVGPAPGVSRHPDRSDRRRAA